MSDKHKHTRPPERSWHLPNIKGLETRVRQPLGVLPPERASAHLFRQEMFQHTQKCCESVFPGMTQKRKTTLEAVGRETKREFSPFEKLNKLKTHPDWSQTWRNIGDTAWWSRLLLTHSYLSASETVVDSCNSRRLLDEATSYYL